MICKSGKNNLLNQCIFCNLSFVNKWNKNNKISVRSTHMTFFSPFKVVYSSRPLKIIFWGIFWKEKIGLTLLWGSLPLRKAWEAVQVQAEVWGPPLTVLLPLPLPHQDWREKSKRLEAGEGPEPAPPFLLPGEPTVSMARKKWQSGKAKLGLARPRGVWKSLKNSVPCIRRGWSLGRNTAWPNVSCVGSDPGEPEGQRLSWVSPQRPREPAQTEPALSIHPLPRSPKPTHCPGSGGRRPFTRLLPPSEQTDPAWKSEEPQPRALLH